MDNKNENFEFFGFPENMEIEIPDETPSPTKWRHGRGPSAMDMIRDMSNMTPEELEKMLPKEGMDDLSKIADKMGLDIDKIMQDTISMAQMLSSTGGDNFINNIFNSMAGFTGMMNSVDCDCDDDCDEECDCCDDESGTRYELADLKYLQPQYFGSVECVEDDDLYEHFTDKYGTDSTKYLDSNLGIKHSYLTEVTAQLPLGNIKNLKFVEANNRFILFYAEPDIENTYGFFVAVVETEDDFALYIPEFRNTFNISNEMAGLFNLESASDLFTIDENGGVSFDNFQLPAIEFAINFALAPKKRPLISPHQFGTIKNILSPINDDAMLLKVGNITSNESSEAILLKKDAELNLEETTFPLYFNFNKIVNKESLQTIANIIFKTNLNEAKLLDFCELKYTSDGRLYIDIDIGDF